MNNQRSSLILCTLVMLMQLVACNQSQQKPAPPVSGGNQVQTPESIARNQVLGVLKGYYASLSAENPETSAYFAPQVNQFFNATNLRPDEVGGILNAGYSTVENRTVKIDTNSLSVIMEPNGGFTATFDGDQAYTRTKDGSLVEEHFRNQISFDANLKIVTYQSLEAAGSGQAARLPGATGVGPAFLENLRAGSTEAMKPYLDANTGCILILQPGAFPVPKWITTVQEIYQGNPALSKKTSAVCDLRMEALPAFDCEEGFSKQGCFMAGAEKYQGISTLLTNLNSAGVGPYSSEDVQKARNLESHIEMKLVDTSAEISLYLGRIEGRWYILAIDMTEFSCEI